MRCLRSWQGWWRERFAVNSSIVATLSAFTQVQSFIDKVALPRLTRFTRAAVIETTIEVDVPGLDARPGSAAETLALKLRRANRPIAVAYATEAGQFQRAGLACVVCGPGSIDQAHKPDEYIDIAQMEACIGFMRRLALELSAG